ncbi:MAG: metallophosphoesterase [Candidatus Brocadia sp.]|nr:metallophosphoesterase [Candidatus Brocadia sp.]MDG6027024.1 metallophosphoesterase [Candidatus Brocadia sp.]
MISRRTFMRGALGCGVGVLSVGGYSRLLEPRWVEINTTGIKIAGLPKRFEGMTIAQISDIHHSKYVPREFVRRCVLKVNALSPDIIVLTGDYIYHSGEFLVPVAEELSELQAEEGVFAVLGNHDEKDQTIQVLSKAGIRVLVNEHVTLYRKSDYLFIAGVDDSLRGRVDLRRTLNGTDDKPKLLLAHNPDVIEMAKDADVDFVMAGHTHGGQVSFPFYGPPAVPTRSGVRYAAGLFYEGNTAMYVNKGIGVSWFPVRFLVRPEITLFTLQGVRNRRYDGSEELMSENCSGGPVSDVIHT